MPRKVLSTILSVMVVFGPVVGQSDDHIRFSSLFRSKPPAESPVIQFARTLDSLEKKLDLDGTVVAKAPDIWGEARLTKHRQEFEREFAKEIDAFDFRLNAAISRTDQAFLANALAISAIGSGTTLKADGTPNVPSALNVSQASSLLPSLSTGTPAASGQSPGSGGAGSTTKNEVIIQNPAHGLVPGEFRVKDKSISIEPEILLDQKARYLNHLNEIRRINEGDDTADSPGYSLNLVRVPVSIMPGTRTRMNHGAEISITATPHLTDELLPVTFRQLIINDLVDLLSPVVRKLAEELPDTTVPLECQSDQFRRLAAFLKGDSEPLGPAVLEYYGERGIANNPGGLEDWARNRLALAQVEQDAIVNRGFRTDDSDRINHQIALETLRFGRLVQEIELLSGQPSRDATLQLQGDNAAKLRLQLRTEEVLSELGQTIYSLAPQLLQTNVGAVTRRAREPIASSQFPFVFGVHELISLSYDFRQRHRAGQTIHLADVRGYLHEELESAFDLVNRPDSVASTYLADPAFVLTNSQNMASLPGRLRNVTHANLRSIFNDRVHVTNQFSRELKVATQEGELEMHLPSVTTSLAWAIVVESVLLNERLNEDIRHVSQNPDCLCNCQGELIFCGANPDPMARQAFADYVKCRWPIHVFALDPQTADQNIADSFSMRREMQLAVALAFAEGRISAQNMTRFVRRIEMDMETIALNRTVASFGHGKDVFGWRFYPRVQTPPFESTTTTVLRDMLRGGPNKDDLRRSWEIEPGMRECTAVVLMPSFITHVTFDVRGNFFPLGRHKLTEPSDTRTSIADNMEMSRQIRQMENAVCSISADANCYRDGEVQRLLRRADQLGKKLPLQTVHARVPNENTLGGFEMFSSGVTDLSPELLDFYGMPGINPDGETILYLVGDNFSVHETRVLAGNRDVDFSLISRQVMQVTIPAGVAVVDNFRCAEKTKCEQPEHTVNVQISTPYGITQPIEIPVIEPTQSQHFRWKTSRIRVNYKAKIKKGSTGLPEGSEYIAGPTISCSRPFELAVSIPKSSTVYPDTAELTFVFSSPELGLSIKSPSKTIAKLSEDGTSYKIYGEEYAALHQSLSTLFISWVNSVEQGKTKAGGVYSVMVESTITPLQSQKSHPVKGKMTLDVTLQIDDND